MRKQLSITSIMEFAAEEATRILGKDASYKNKVSKALKIFKSILKYYPIRELKYSFYPPIQDKNKKDVITSIIIRSNIYRNIYQYIKAVNR